jgi:hypothetical protein
MNHRDTITKESLTLTGYKNWSISRASRYSHWEAFLRDESIPDTGAPLFEALSFDSLVDLIEAFEAGSGCNG